MVSETVKEKKKRNSLIGYLIVGTIGYIYIIIVALHYLAIRNIYKRMPMGEALNNAFSYVFIHPFEIFGNVSGKDILMIVILSVLGLCFAGMYYTTHLLKKHDNPDTVNGDAHWMKLKEYKEYCMKRCSPFGEESINGYDNVILSKEMRLSMDGIRCKRNCNTLAIGGSGSGKSRNFAAPNILSANCCNIITDPSGELYRDYAQYLADMGYEVKVFNLTNVYQGCRYNPFHYIVEEKDVFIITNTIMENTTPPEQKGGDPFWPKAETLLISALMLYLWHTQPKEAQTFSNLLFLISCAEIDENNSSKKSVLDQMFENLEKDDPENLAVKQYKGFKLGAGKTLKSILISVKARLQIFELSDIKYLTSTDNLDLDKFADTRQILFVIIPTADDTFNFVVSMLYTQLFMSLYRYCETRSFYGWQCKIRNGITLKVEQAANKDDSERAKAEIERFVGEIRKGIHVKYDNDRHLYKVFTTSTNELVGWRGSVKLRDEFIKDLARIKIEPVGESCPNHVRLLGDEFANMSAIPNLDKRLSTVRKYNISMFIILQAITQLQKMYKDDWNTIAGNCDVKLFLGSSDNETIKWLCETGGKKTTRVQNLNFNGKQGESFGINLSSYDLITPDLLSMMKDDECLVLVRAERPYYGEKYDVKMHPMYEYAKTRRGMYEIKPPEEVGEIISNIPFHERLNLTDGYENLDRVRQERRKKLFKSENAAGKDESISNVEAGNKERERIKEQRKQREEEEDAINQQQMDAVADMLTTAVKGKNKEKLTPKEIVDMDDTAIQEAIESRINIEPYPMDEWVYMMT